MKIGILKAAETFELAVLKYNPATDLYSLAVSYTLNQKSPLGDCKGKLLDLKLDELWFLPMSSILNENISDKKIGTYSTGNSHRDIVINSNDITKIKDLCESTDIHTMKIMNIYDVLQKMVTRPTVFVTDYHKQIAYLYYNKEGLKDHRIWREADVDKLQTLMEQKSTKLALPIYNTVLNDTLSKRIVNWDSLELKYKVALSPTLGSILIEPSCVYKMINGVLIEAENKTMEDVEDLTPSPVQEFHREAPVVSSKVSTVVKEKPQKDKLGLALNVVGVMMSVLFAGSLIANKQLPSDIEYLQGKQEELVSLVTPKQDTLDYYDKFINSLNTENTNFDLKTVSSIKAIDVDGILAEIKLQKSEVGIVVYLKDASTIDAYTEQLGGVFEVTQVANKGTVSLENTTLTKFIVNGIR